MARVEGRYRMRPGPGYGALRFRPWRVAVLTTAMICGLLVRGGTVDAPSSPETDAAHPPMSTPAPETLKVHPAAGDLSPPTQPDASKPAPQPLTEPRTQPTPVPRPETTSVPTRAAPRFDGVPAPGLRIWLDARGSAGEGNHYKWIQTRGPAVNLDLPDADRVSFIVPGGARELGFTLVAYGKGGMDDRSLVIPLIVHPRQNRAPTITADAGDDQIAVLGRQVTLNGIRSLPTAGLKYRWTQVDGPRLRSKYEEGSCCTFTPEEQGMYRFLLVVANTEEISEASEVKVFVSASCPGRTGRSGARGRQACPRRDRHRPGRGPCS